MSKKRIDTSDILSESQVPLPQQLYNSTKKYKFELVYKYNHIYITIMRKDTSDFHIGTYKFSSIEDIKSSPEILRYLQLVDVDDFFKNFKY